MVERRADGLVGAQRRGRQRAVQVANTVVEVPGGTGLKR